MTEDRLSGAFNRGSDARLRGEPIEANPFDFTGQWLEWLYWIRGWEDVQFQFPRQRKEQQCSQAK